MNNQDEKINQLLSKLESLSNRQAHFLEEIKGLRSEINRLKTDSPEVIKEKEVQKETPTVTELETVKQPVEIISQQQAPQPVVKKQPKTPKAKTDIEKFIGENLINKIGIAILVIGVGIGAKYSIENDLISPLTRIILGYIAGIGLLGFGIKLKKKYLSYSAVLVSGAIAIMYFITFAAYSFYGLFPQTFAFVLMVVFTVFTVVAAINYNKQVIAHIGLVGAYAIPFLLSENSGQVAILFSYMLIINTGILVIAFKKYWKALYYVAFSLTWVIYFSWFISDYDIDFHFSLALIFLTLFFVLFYVCFLAYKLIRKEKFGKTDIVLLLINSFIFYGLGFAILDSHEIGEQLLGLFTLANAIIHFATSVLIYKLKLADKKLFYLIIGMVLVFITIAVPVQLNGNWVTLIWVGEAALLFWIARAKKIVMYEKLAYPLMFLAFISLIQDWSDADNYYYYSDKDSFTPILNINFLSALLFVVAFGFINYVNQKKETILDQKNSFVKIVSFCIPAIFLFTLYYAFRIEIENYWSQLYRESSININVSTYNNYDLTKFRVIWVINYSLLFVAALTLINNKKLKNKLLGYVSFSLTILAIIVFLGQGLYVLSELRESYLEQTLAEYYNRGMFNVGIRYVSYGFFILLLFSCYKYLHEKFNTWKFRMLYDLILYISVLWMASSELINWMDIAESTQSYKLGLSILWGVFALFLIGLGIWKKKKHLRIGAISLFGITLVKLFLYDISHLNTISKTIVFVSLGILLLIISFLYNKYKHTISDENNS